MKIRLTEVCGDTRLASHELNKTRIKIGRDPALNDLAFERDRWPMVSRQHAIIALQDDDWYVSDSGSANGTFVNGERVAQPTKLEVPSVIRLAPDGPELKVELVEDVEVLANETMVDIDAAQQQAALLAIQEDFGVEPKPTSQPQKIAKEIKPIAAQPLGANAKTDARSAVGLKTQLDASLAELPAHIICESGAPTQLGQTYLLVKDQIMIGRDVACDVKIEDLTTAVSRRHAEIRRQPDGTFTILDHSFNGTLVNDQRITGSMVLHDDDRIQLALGGPVFRFVEPAVKQQPKTHAGDRSSVVMPPRQPALPTSGKLGMLTIVSRAAGAPTVSPANDEAQFLFERSFDGKPQISVGRGPDNDIQLDGLLISKSHACFVISGQQVSVRDLGSTNGVYLNGQRVTGVRTLQTEDVVQIGPFILRVTANAGIAVFDTRASTRLEGVGLSAMVSRGSKRLLDDVNLAIQPNEFVGVLGPSGAGKSILLGALNGRRRPDSGRVLINNLDLYQHLDSLKQWIGFVPQDDIIHRELTVYKTLYYVARLRLSRDVPKAEIDHVVGEVLDVTGLADRRDVIISQLSGGQRKRVSIAVELITKPSLIFLDEPTSGLDPATEQRMMKLFRQIAESGRTVVLTTHAMENVSLFDRVALLLRGKLIFYGSPKEALEFIGADSFIDLYNKLDLPLQAELAKLPALPVNASRTDVSEHERQREAIAETVASEWQQRFKSSPLYRRYVEQPLTNLHDQPTTTTATVRHRSIVDSMRQWGTLTRRYLRVLGSDKWNLFVIFAQAPVIGLLMYLVIGRTDSRDFLYFILSLVSIWFGTSLAARELVRERPIFERERMVNLRLLPYVGSKLIVLSLIVLIQTLLLFATAKVLQYTGVLYFPGVFFGLPHFATMALTAIVGITIGLFISALVRTSEVATSLVPLILIPQILFAGLFSVPTGWSRVIGAAMPATWSFDEMKRLSTLDTLKETGADPNGPSHGQGLYKLTKEENSQQVAKAQSEVEDYTRRVSESLASQSAQRSAVAARSGPGDSTQARNAQSPLPSPPAIPTPQEINEDLSHYVAFKHPWGGRLRNPAILLVMLLTLAIGTVIVLRVKDIR